MNRITQSSLKFLNSGKKELLDRFLVEYRNCVKFFVDEFWSYEKVPSLVSSEIYQKYESVNLTACVIQAAAKQASGIVRGVRSKRDRLVFVQNKLKNEQKYKDSRKLEKFINKLNISKPDIDTINPELGERYLTTDFDPKTKDFDMWVTISSVFKDKTKIIVPLKKTKHFNNLKETFGTNPKKHIRLSDNNIGLLFQKKETIKTTNGKTIGLDVGISNVFTTSDNQFSIQDNHGHTLTSITKKLSRKKKGSKGFFKAQIHRMNYISWSVKNCLDLTNIEKIRVEKIKNLRKFKKTSRFLQHWNYRDIFSKIQLKCEQHGVLVEHVSPTYTSQRCHKCGWTQKKNRDGKQFSCKKCLVTLDADLNGAINISLSLPRISKDFREQKKNITGFFWHQNGLELIVPNVQ